MDDANILILGAKGQLGTALSARYPGARQTDQTELDITNFESVNDFDWSGIKIILNAAAYTAVDAAETVEGRTSAWNVNAHAVANLSAIASQHGITLVHISTDYVFDGTSAPHSETESFAPLSVYGASKAAGDIAAGLTPNHYILRTSWVIGEGKNFVRTMLGLGARGISPSVVDDQIGRLTFTSELVRAISHLLETNSPYGTYNVTNSGESASWADITRQIFLCAGHDLTVTGVTTQDYFKDKTGIAPRPLQSVLNLTKLQSTGFESLDWETELQAYIKHELEGV